MARSYGLLSALLEANNADNEISRRQAQFIRENVFNVAADSFILSYRLSEELIGQLEADLSPYIKDSSRGISRRVKILCALSFLAHGTYQRTVGQQYTTRLSQASVSRALQEFLSAITQPTVIKKYIRFPQNGQERHILKTRFYDKFKIPGCIGCIDGTYVAMIRPIAYEERYFCRKGYHARNVQLVTDADLNILHVDASYGGASHDNFIFNHSDLRLHLEALGQSDERTYLLGDSGYAQRTFLMTPVEDAEEQTPEAYYNKLHGTARNSVERVIGLLKGRFRCLLVHRVLHYNPDTVAKIVIACCVLHNICNRAGLPAPVISGRGNDSPTDSAEPVDDDPLRMGRNARSALVNRLWLSR